MSDDVRQTLEEAAAKVAAETPEDLSSAVKEQKLEAASNNVLDKLFADVVEKESITVEFPSTGRFYQVKDPSKPVTLRPMTFEDEKVLVSLKRNQGDPTTVLLERCLDNIEVQQLFLFDKVYLILKLREISYGNEYSALITCPTCKEENNIAFDIGVLEIKYLPENMDYPLPIELPGIKKTAKVTFPRVSDDSYFGSADQTFSQMWRFIEDIGGITDPPTIVKALDRLPLEDIHTLVRYIAGNEFGIQTEVRFLCDSCEEVTKMELPITSDFFSVS